MGKIAFVFSGQGGQYQGMGQEIYNCSKKAKEAFEFFDSVRAGTSWQCFTGEQETLNQTVNTQPCVFAVDMACALALEEAGIKADGVAGFSLGEIAAITFAGILNMKDGFSLVAKRGQLMEEASKSVEGSMVAVMKMQPEDVKSLADEMGVYAVNFNSPQQISVAGEKSKIKEFSKEVKAKKGLPVPIKVSGAFHTPYMSLATEGLATTLKDMEVKVSKVDVYSNITAKPYPQDKDEIVNLISKQASSPVKWCQTIENMIRDGYDTFYEVGPGNTLTNLIKKINLEVEVFNIEKKEDLDNVRK